MADELIPIRLLVADGHRLFRDGVRKLMESQPDLVVTADCNEGAEAVRLVRELRPDVLLLDHAIPGLSGLEVLSRLARARLPVRTILLASTIDRSEAVRALQCGAQGVVLKQSPTELLFKAVRTVMSGQYWIDGETVSVLVETLRRLSAEPASAVGRFSLTRRELEIARLVVAGCSNKDIAREIGVCEDTVKHHLTSIFDKTGASNRLELALFAIHHHLVPTESGSLAIA